MKIYLCAFFSFFIIHTFAQNDKYTEPPIWGFNLGISAGKYVNVEAGYGISYFFSRQKSFKDYDYKTFLLASDLSAEWLPGKKFWGPKLSCKFLTFNEKSTLGFIAGGEYILYNHFKELVPTIRPTFGLQFLAGTLELSYGYNFATKNDFQLPLNTHVVQFRIKPVIIYELLSRAWE